MLHLSLCLQVERGGCLVKDEDLRVGGLDPPADSPKSRNCSDSLEVDVLGKRKVRIMKTYRYHLAPYLAIAGVTFLSTPCDWLSACRLDPDWTLDNPNNHP